MRRARTIVAVLAAALVAGCGGSRERDPVAQVGAAERDRVAAAQEVDLSAFPAPGESIEQLAARFETDGPQAAAATSVFRKGENRLAFGILDEDIKFVYGDTVVYLQHSEGGNVQGPYAAPADVLVTEPRYRSQQAASEEDPFAAVYEAIVPLERTGIWNVLAVSDIGDGRRIAAPLRLEVVSRGQDKIPDVGEMAPRVHTDTVASANGDIESIDTRLPPAEELHRDDFADLHGEEPVALLFATPQLCASRVCGPVVDQALQLNARYGDRINFIHQEVYVDNRVDRGLRPPLQHFGLQTEPWLFVVDADGRVTARLEGSFGLRAFERALKTAL